MQQINSIQTNNPIPDASQGLESKNGAQISVHTVKVFKDTTVKVAISSPAPSFMSEAVKSEITGAALANGIGNNENNLLFRDSHIEHCCGAAVRNHFSSRARHGGPHKSISNLEPGQVIPKPRPVCMKPYSGLIHCVIDDNSSLKTSLPQVQQSLNRISNTGASESTLVFSEVNGSILGRTLDNMIEELKKAIAETDETLRPGKIIFLVESEASLKKIKSAFKQECSASQNGSDFFPDIPKHETRAPAISPMMKGQATNKVEATGVGIQTKEDNKVVSPGTDREAPLTPDQLVVKKKTQKKVKMKERKLEDIDMGWLPQKSKSKSKQTEKAHSKPTAATQPQIPEERQTPARVKFHLIRGETNKALKALEAEDINADMGKPSHLSPLMAFISSMHGLSDKTLQELIQKGADVNERKKVIINDREVNITPLMYVIHLYNYAEKHIAREQALRKTLSVLLKANAQVNTLSECPTEDKKSETMFSATPLALAVINYRHSHRLIPILLEHGANANTLTSEGESSLNIICHMLNDDAMTSLFKHHPNPQEIHINKMVETDQDKFSNLHLLVNGLACELVREGTYPQTTDLIIDRTEKLINILKKYAVDFSAKTESGETAADLAQKNFDKMFFLSSRQKHRIINLFSNQPCGI